MVGLLAWRGAVSSGGGGRWDGLAVCLHPCAAPSADECRCPWGGIGEGSTFPSAISDSLPGVNVCCQKNVLSYAFFPLDLWKHCAFLLPASQLVPALPARTEFPLSHREAG